MVRFASSPLLGRALMLGGLARIANRRDPTSRALARAFRTTALGQTPGDEREWIRRIEVWRRELTGDQRAVSAEIEPGAGAPDWVERINRPAPVWGIPCLFGIAPQWGLFQMRLVRELAPVSCLELGTGIGLSAAYQAAALELNGTGTLTTLDRARGWGAVAGQGLSALGLAGRVRIHSGEIDDTAPRVLERIAPLDYAFFDADHTEQATVRHFDMVLPHLAPGAVAVLDDLSFSAAMRRAWSTIRRRDRVSTSMALGRMAVVAVD
jgi:predicted O-methyltransferase YrrM